MNRRGDVLRAFGPVCLMWTMACAGPLVAQEIIELEIRQITWTALEGTSEIRGVVTRADDALPVASAQVSIPGSDVGALTREDGSFLIVNPPAEWNELLVARIGFRSQSFERPGPGAWAVQIKLVPFELDLCGLEVSVPPEIPSGHIAIRARSIVTGEAIASHALSATLHNLGDGVRSDSFLEDGNVLVHVPGVGQHVLQVEADGFKPWWTPLDLTKTNCMAPRGRSVDAWLVPAGPH